MNYTLLEEARELVGWNEESEALCVYTAMQQLRDARRKQGKRYPLALVLTSVLVAKAAGETTLQAIAEWIRLRGSWVQEVLPGVRASFPCAATDSNVLRAVDPEPVNEIVLSLVTRARAATREPGEQEQVALDGTTLKGTQRHEAEDQKKIHHVCLYETQTGVVLKEQGVKDQEREQTRVEEFLTPLDVKGRIVSADALPTHATTCASILASGGDSLFFAKGNQSTLTKDLHLFFTEPPVDCGDWRTAETLDAGHGRIEQRALIASTELHDFLARDWPRIGQAFRLRRRFHHPFKCTQQIVYGFTSLTSPQAGPERLLELMRAPWAIENKLHYRRDVTLREDACHVRKGQAPRTLAILNSVVLALFDWLEVANVASQMRLFAARPFLALRLFMVPLERMK
jgi:predicted transposase YbfD/YdcC